MKLIIRADSSAEMGTGHVMRCLALGQAWQNSGGEVVFITACREEGLIQRLRNEEFDVHLLTHSYPNPSDWAYVKDVLSTNPNAWVVLDGYHFDEIFHQLIKRDGHRLLVIDDMCHLEHYYADIVLNQNLHAEHLSYSSESDTRLLLGSQYALLRREFRALKETKREIPQVAKRVLITLGGADPENHTLEVVQTLRTISKPSDLEVIVVIGVNNPHEEALERAISESPISIDIVRNVQNMAEILMWADLAVSAAGSTVWELSYLGVPMLLLPWQKNQEQIAQSLVEAGIALNFEAASLQQLLQDRDTRVVMHQMATSLVTGHGAEHLVEILRNIE